MLVPGSGRGAGRLKGFPSKAPFLTHRSLKHVPPPPPLSSFRAKGEGRGSQARSAPQAAGRPRAVTSHT